MYRAKKTKTGYVFFDYVPGEGAAQKPDGYRSPG
jgi:hypothetical protein